MVHSQTVHSQTVHSQVVHSQTAHSQTAHSQTVHSKSVHSKTVVRIQTQNGNCKRDHPVEEGMNCEIYKRHTQIMYGVLLIFATVKKNKSD